MISLWKNEIKNYCNLVNLGVAQEKVGTSLNLNLDSRASEKGIAELAINFFFFLNG